MATRRHNLLRQPFGKNHLVCYPKQTELIPENGAQLNDGCLDILYKYFIRFTCFQLSKKGPYRKSNLKPLAYIVHDMPIELHGHDNPPTEFTQTILVITSGLLSEIAEQNKSQVM